MKKRVLLVRLDKIGDLISTMCVDQLKHGYGQPLSERYQITWCISKGLGFIPEAALPPREFIELDKSQPKESRLRLRDFLKENPVDVVVSFQAPWWVHYECWRARVPVRSGVLSQWHSFLFLNKGLRQRRSLAEKHEADYNRELLEHALDLESQETPLLRLDVAEDRELLKKFALKNKSYVVVHPGMAGSALNWSSQNYIALIKEVLKTHPVVFTGTAMDEPYLAPLKKEFAQNKNVINLQNQLKALELFQILKSSHAVIAPSTGVAHMAAALGAKILGIYSPIRVQHPRRWAARGENVIIFQPPFDCPADFKCLGSACKHFDCMNKITVDQVYRKL